MIDLNPKYLERVQHILAEHVPECEVRAYGSRVTWTAKDYSDLDLAVVGSEPFNLRRMRQLKEAFEESDLPIRVDVLDWYAVSDGFKKAIAEEYEVIQDGKLDKETAESEYSCQSWNQENNGWDLVRLGNVVSINPRRTLHRGKTTIHVSMKDIEAFRREIASHSFKEFNGSATRFRNDDTLLARITPCLENGKTAYVNCLKANEVGHGSTEFIVLSGIEGKTDNLFIYYLARDPSFRTFAVHSMQGTTGRQRVAPDSLGLFEFALPPIEQQRRIAHILGSLDDRIELNRQMNETLEAMARAIFKSWFVDFDPVRAKMEGREPVGMDANTAALFPSAFQDSPLGEIPEGWEVTQVKKQVARIQYGFTQSASNEPVGPKFLRITDIANGMLDWGSVPFCYISEKHYDKYKLQDGDILVARTGATTGANIYIVDPPDAVFASYLVRIQFANLSLARLVSEFMRSSIYNDYVAGCIGGSAQPNASAQLLTAVEFAFPPMEVVERFYETVHPLDKRHAANNRQSQTLAEIRDVLLPQLLSGEIRVNRTETGQHD